MSEVRPIRITLPAGLLYRDVAIRTVTAACHLVGHHDEEQDDAGPNELDLRRAFDGEFISAFSEIFNNISIHAYGGGDKNCNREDDARKGDLTLDIVVGDDFLELTLTDMGIAFELKTVRPPELDALPEGGMGIHIARACLDELHYQPGPPNVWRLKKFLNLQTSNE